MSGGLSNIFFPVWLVSRCGDGRNIGKFGKKKKQSCVGCRNGESRLRNAEFPSRSSQSHRRSSWRLSGQLFVVAIASAIILGHRLGHRFGHRLCGDVAWLSLFIPNCTVIFGTNRTQNHGALGHPSDVASYLKGRRSAYF